LSIASVIKRAKLPRFLKDGAVRSVGVLVSGTALSQLILLLALPILTRLYSPEDFSLLAVYVGLVSIVSVAACLRFDIAVPIPEATRDGLALLVLALASSVLVSLAIALVVLVGFRAADSIEILSGFGLYIWLVPVGIFLASANSALQFWATRVKAFPFIARTRILQSTCAVGGQVGLGLAGMGAPGLLVGQLINSGAGAFAMARLAISDARRAGMTISIPELRRVARTFQRFPRYSTWEAIANSAGTHLPVIAIAALFIGPEAGFVMLAMRVMTAPMGLVGGAVAQVYLSRAPEHFRNGTLAPFTASTLAGLSKSGVGPLIFAGIVAPPAFAWIFGEDWRRAGELVAWMTPWFVMQFLASPVSMTLHVTNQQRVALILQIIGLALRLGVVILTSFVAPYMAAESYALSGFAFYTIYLVTVLTMTQASVRDVTGLLQSCLPYLLVWGGLGLVVRFIVGG
jgi:O-antigen/teichoic acid export membrane protein